VLVVIRAENRAVHARDHPDVPLTEEQATADTVDAAVAIVAVARLADPAGAYAFRPCSTSDGPPYRVVVQLTFTVPQGNPPAYLDGVAADMIGAGWREAPTDAPHFGHKLTGSGLTATFFRNTERTDLATMTVDGECRVVTDHRRDGWIDLTGRLRSR
jgi:hypothetical protein